MLFPLPVTVMTSATMYEMDNVSVNPEQSGFTHGMTTTGGEINFHTADPTPQFHVGVTEDIASYGRNRVGLHLRTDLAFGFIPHFGHVDDGWRLPA
ncbi:hypothetical protein K6L44_10900 [Gluconacetobacter entanii]|uniref:hypothetical protein n=1 Tax=Gluconacetobacter entanii TaxID=108528 RepID=UPI001C9355AD|nr:hypothetical protein [Gluconacetobacter entanii]MBY4640482.1 hypothetical protein [Gluconacetobacter entanii]MCW4581349.1 hypothetical protein [Gluconacetobacter entanii]MCW4584811.1 hypothetical protein [Gluconacetobacter entanii]MCW4588225.1 hypothetical protein [Gluconacetobacter entanii]